MIGSKKCGGSLHAQIGFWESALNLNEKQEIQIRSFLRIKDRNLGESFDRSGCRETLALEHTDFTSRAIM